MLTTAALLGTMAVGRAEWPGSQSAVQSDSSDHRPAMLFISVDDPTRSYVQNVIRGLQEALAQATQPPLLYLEFFDEARFGDVSYEDDYRAWLERKYRGRRIDVVLTSAESMLRLLARQPGSFLGHVPIVSGSVGPPAADVLALLPTMSVVIVESNLPAVIATARQLRPQASRFALVYGASRVDRDRGQAVATQLQRAGLATLDLGGLPMEALLDRVRDLPTDTVPLLLGVQVDGAGRAFPSPLPCRLVSEAASAPLFALAAPIGCGVIGGPLGDFTEAGRALGREALARLAGSAAGRTVTVPLALHAPMTFDARQLARWGIDDARLPADSNVQFRSPSLWREHRAAVIAASVTGAALVLLMAVILLEQRRRTVVLHALQQSNDRVHDLAGRLIASQEEERTRIARDLHDDVGQRLASLSIGLSRIKRALEQERPPVAAEVAMLQEQTNDLSQDLRQLAHELHPGVLAQLGLVAAIRARCHEVTRETGIPVSFTHDGPFPELPPPVVLCLFRVAQEGLRNVVRHSQAHAARLSATCAEGMVSLSVSDDGQGFDTAAAARTGLGLRSLDERVRLLNGRLEVSSWSQVGSTITASIPHGS